MNEPTLPTARARSLPTLILLGALGAVAPLVLAQDAPPSQPPADAAKSPSGLVSQVLRQGTSTEKADGNDEVEVQFTGWDRTGKKFAGTQEGKPAKFSLSQVFPGWREGITLMRVGEKRRLWIPSNLGPQTTSGPKDAIFDVELLTVTSLPDPPKQLQSPDPTAERTLSGAFSKMVSAGKGTDKPDRSARVLLNYTLWSGDGRTIESTISRSRPTAFMLDRVMPAFAECVQLMVVGEKRLCWIPENVAAGQWPGAPKGMMVFEMEFLRLLAADSIQLGDKTKDLKSQGTPPPAKGGGGLSI